MRRKEKHAFYNYQFKHTAVKITDHPNIQSIDVAEALGIHLFMLSRWCKEYREGKYVPDRRIKKAADFWVLRGQLAAYRHS